MMPTLESPLQGSRKAPRQYRPCGEREVAKPRAVFLTPP